MAYLESTAVTDRDAFITAIVSFAVANAGFADEGTSIDGEYTIYHISKGGMFWNFVADAAEGEITISTRMSFAKITTFAAFISIATAGQRYSTMMVVYQSGPYIKYFLYTEGNAIHGVLQIYNDVWSHISFGNMIKFGAWIGGEYVTANGSFISGPGYYQPWDHSYRTNGILFDGGYNNVTALRTTGYVRHLIAAPSNNYLEFARLGNLEQYDQKCQMVTMYGMLQTLIGTCSSIDFNMRSPLFPVYVKAWETVTNRWRLVGYVPGTKVLDIGHISSASIVENDWITFPMIQRHSGDRVLSPRSYDWGVAYKRIA